MVTPPFLPRYGEYINWNTFYETFFKTNYDTKRPRMTLKVYEYTISGIINNFTC